MIAKMSAGNSMYSVLSYNQSKVEAEHAKVIFSQRMIVSRDGIFDIPTCLRSFEPYLLANRQTENPVLHVSINPDPQDTLTNEQLSDIAQTYMRRMGYGDQPYLVYLHEDIERRHIHIVSLRVDENGRKISDTFEHRRSMEVCRELEREYHLIPADKKTREEGLPLKEVDFQGGDVKHQIASVIRPLAASWHFQSLKEYRSLLSLYNIGVEEVRGEAGGKPYRGLVYSALDDEGKTVGHPFKSSLFGKSVGIEALEKRFERSTAQIKEKKLKERTKRVVTTALRSTRDRIEFEGLLARQSISVLFRTNETNRIYGVTFIDHEQRCVFNGSRIGKAFSANVFEERFNGEGKLSEALERQEWIPQAWEQDRQPHAAKPQQGEESSTLGELGGLFDMSFGETAADEHAEEMLRRRTKKTRKGRKM
jgi:hypothetical protein